MRPLDPGEPGGNGYSILLFWSWPVLNLQYAGESDEEVRMTVRSGAGTNMSAAARQDQLRGTAISGAPGNSEWTSNWTAEFCCLYYCG
jgi:hypothetical protein